MYKLLSVLIICAMTFTLSGCIVYQRETYVVTFDAKGGNTPNVQYVERGRTASMPSSIREGYTIEGWYTSLDEGITLDEKWSFSTSVVKKDLTLYAHWIKETNGIIVGSNVGNALVGKYGMTYLIPTKISDSGTAQVKGGFKMAKTETTYELWYEILAWAENNDYYFQNKGREGNDGVIGAPPTSNKLEPVTYISWRDVIVWCNAYSVFKGLDPVYRTTTGVIIKDSRDTNAIQVDAANQTENNGYRLPTSNEWELAARWRKSSGNGTIAFGGRYWTMGSNASGAVSGYNNMDETSLVTWYKNNANNSTHPVASKKANDLGIYDMCGNVWEWCFDWDPGHIGQYRIIRGGSFNFDNSVLQVGFVYSYLPNYASSEYGFRIVRTFPDDELSVGEEGVIYTIPTDITDSSIAQVKGGFKMAKTETTYELWYDILAWAENNDYYFQNKGREGNDGVIGAPPTSNKLEPVTSVSWRDVIVWCNAYSEYIGLNPVYQTSMGKIIRDARDANASEVDSTIQTDCNGYRLPTSNEWELAARWRNTSGDGSIFIGGRYWTIGSNASGAISDYNNLSETSLVAWYDNNSNQSSHQVALKKANDLGIYDMSGNVWEWCFDLVNIPIPRSRIIKGGAYNQGNYTLRVGTYYSAYSTNAMNYCGFRLVRTV